MNSLQDSIYNWLTIKVVSDARPDDTAAVETEMTFKELLATEHQLINIVIEKDETMYDVHFEQNGERKKLRFPREMIEVLLNQIKAEPERYVNYPIE